MVTLAPLDWAVVAIFAIGLLALGFSARLRESNVLQFLAAGRSLTLPFFVTSLVATWYGGILGVGESVASFGVGTFLLIGVPYYVFGIVYAVWLSKRVREADQISIPERLEAAFGKRSAVVGAVLLVLMAVPAAHSLMLGTLAQALTGQQLVPAVILATLVGSVFLFKGGLFADVRVSVLSFILMYVGFAVALVVGVSKFGSPFALQGLDPNLSKVDGGAGPVAVVTFFILGAWTLVDPGFHQRAASAVTPEVGRRGVLVSVGCWMVFDLLSVSVGLLALRAVTPMPESKLLLFPLFAQAVLPTGVKALFLVGMAGTVTTALVSYALVSGASIGRDVFCRLRPGRNELAATRVGIGIALVVAVFLAVQIKSVVALWYSWSGAIVGALLWPVWVAYRGKPSRDTWTAVSMALGAATGLGWMWWGTVHDNPYLNVKLPATVFGYNLFGALAGTDVGIGTLVPAFGVTAVLLALGTASKKGEHESDRRARGDRG